MSGRGGGQGVHCRVAAVDFLSCRWAVHIAENTNGECRSEADLARHGDRAAQHGGEAFDQCEAKPGAAKPPRSRGIALNEGLEQLGDLVFAHADAGI